MSDLKSFAHRVKSKNAELRAEILRKFGRDEDGSIIVFTLVLLIIMLVMGGMAVDFMRFESRRALLQSVADRSVLAAAELDQTLDSKEVVVDFFEKAGFDGTIVGEPRVSGNARNRSVAVDASLDIDTFYLRFIGIDELAAPATAAATEGTGNVEISLVLDITGSMGREANGSGRTRLDLLQDAASNFVDELLKPEYVNQISISLVAYSEHVNLGDEIFGAIPTTAPTRFDTSEWRAGLIDISELDEPFPRVFREADLPPPFLGTEIVLDTDLTNIPDGVDGNNPGIEPLYTVYSNPSRCVDVPASEFTTTTFNNSITYEQIENYDPYGDNTIAAPIRPICPENDYEAIIPLSQNAQDLKDAINAYTPRTNTSIHAGLKWGVTLIDPSFRPILETVPSVDPAFSGVRPANYSSESTDEITAKYIVLMTDGSNVQGYRLAREYENDREPAYENVLQRSYWGNSSYAWWSKSTENQGPFDSYNFEKRGVSAGEKNTMMQNICTAAKDRGIILYTIAMDAPTDGETQMRSCATSAAHYYETESAAVDDVLASIAKQITNLRLSL